jgi:hypothetical protein
MLKIIIPKGIFGPKREEVTEGRKMYNEELHNLYSSSDINMQIKSRTIRRGKCTTFWWESPKERDYLEDQGVDGRMGLELSLGRLVGGV